jgi:hypothetical protein
MVVTGQFYIAVRENYDFVNAEYSEGTSDKAGEGGSKLMGLRTGNLSGINYQKQRIYLLCNDTAWQCNAHGPIATFCRLEYHRGFRCVEGNRCVIGLFLDFAVALPLLMQHLAHSKALNIERGPTLAFVSPRPMILCGCDAVRNFRNKSGDDERQAESQIR